jgi:hypothetical protein
LAAASDGVSLDDDSVTKVGATSWTGGAGLGAAMGAGGAVTVATGPLVDGGAGTTGVANGVC